MESVHEPLESLLGKTAAQLLLYLFHHGEAFPAGVAADLGLSETGVRHQCRKLELAGVLISKPVGRARVYQVQKKSPLARRLMSLVEVVYEGIPQKELEALFRVRRRPRREGKPFHPREPHDPGV